MAWAGGFGPLPEGMPFLHPVQLERAIAFWKINPMLPGLSIDPGGSVWPDFLGHGGVGGISFFVSDRVLYLLRSNNVQVGRTTEMPIAEIKAKRLRHKSPPKYFVVETLPGIEVDYVASEIPTDAMGKSALIPLPKPWPPQFIRARASSWNGTDLFSYGNWGGPLEWVCTEKLKDLVERACLINIEFQPRKMI